MKLYALLFACILVAAGCTSTNNNPSTGSTDMASGDMTQDSVKIESATNWLNYADAADHETTWKRSSELFQSAVEPDDWRKSLNAARAPLGPLLSRSIGSVEALEQPSGAPDGNYVKLMFNSSFEKKKSALETVTLIEEQDGKWRVAGYFIK